MAKSTVPFVVSDAILGAFVALPIQRTPFWRWDILALYQKYPRMSMNLIPSSISESVLRDAIKYYKALRSPTSKTITYARRFPHIARAFYTYFDRTPYGMKWLIEALLVGSCSDQEVVAALAAASIEGLVDAGSDQEEEEEGYVAALIQEEKDGSAATMAYAPGEDHADLLAWISSYRSLFFDVRQYGGRRRVLATKVIAPARTTGTIATDFDYAWKLTAYILGAERFAQMQFDEHAGSETDLQIKALVRKHLSCLAVQASAAAVNGNIQDIVDVLKVARDFWGDVGQGDDLFERSEKLKAVEEWRENLTLIMQNPQLSGDTVTISEHAAEFEGFTWDKSDAKPVVDLVKS